jgi:hypothetical protein
MEAVPVVDATPNPGPDVQAVDAAVLQSTGAADVGVTAGGFVPKPFARILAEKLALARGLLGDDLDLTSSSLIRKLLEISALEDARTWAALAGMYDNSFAATATGEPLTMLGAELGLPRPFIEASGTITLQLAGTLPAGAPNVTLPLGSRLLTSSGDDIATAATAVLSTAQPRIDLPVVAFRPGPGGNLDPAAVDASGGHPHRIASWNPLDVKLQDYFALVDRTAGAVEVAISHSVALTRGEQRWPDERYRALLLRAPRSLWSADSLQAAVALVPGVRQVRVIDAWGGLDLTQSLFGNFSFLERVFSAERDVASPYYVTVLVASTPAAIWAGPTGLRAAVLAAVEDLRPLGIFPNVEQGEEVAVSLLADIVVAGVPLPAGPPDVVNASAQALALKQRLSERIRGYVSGLSFGEPVRAAEVTWALMSEPAVQDVQNLALLRWPGPVEGGEPGAAPDQPTPSGAVRLGRGENVTIGAAAVASYVPQPDLLRVVPG